MGYGELDIRSSGKFLKIEAGAPHDLRILNADPVERIIHGFGKEAKRCTGEDCVYCEESEASQRFITNVYDHGVRRVMIWEFGVTIARKLRSIDNTLREEGKTIMDTDIKVEASGSGMGKKYEVTPRMTSKPVPPGLVLHKIVDELGF